MSNEGRWAVRVRRVGAGEDEVEGGWREWGGYRWRLHNEMQRGEHTGFVSPTSALCMTEANMTLMEFDPAEQWARG